MPASYESLNTEPLTPPVITLRRNRDYVKIAILITLVLNLLMLIVFFVTFVESLEMFIHSPFIKKLGDTFEELDLKSLIHVFQRVRIGKIESFIDNIVTLADKVDTDDIILFAEALDQCVVSQCTRRFG